MKKGSRSSLKHVTGFTYQDQRVTGVDTADGEHYSADVVVSNMDPSHLYRKVIPQQKQHIMTRAKTAGRASMGLFVLYLVPISNMMMWYHTIWLGKRYKPLLDDIFNKQYWRKTFRCIYITYNPNFALKVYSFAVSSANMAAKSIGKTRAKYATR